MRVFDLDGTLFNTYPAVKEAYQMAGLKEYTPEMFGKSARELGIPLEIRRAKAEFYKKTVCGVKKDWAFKYYTPHTDIVLTGASEEAVSLLRRQFKVALCTPFGYGLSLDEKVKVLLKLAMIDRVTYYDDNKAIGRFNIPGKLDIVLKGA